MCELFPQPANPVSTVASWRKLVCRPSMWNCISKWIASNKTEVAYPIAHSL